MGASTFIVHTKPYANAREAFNDAIRDAAWEYGHGGYTGTIAEKSNFFLIEKPRNRRLQSRTLLKAVQEINHVSWRGTDAEKRQWKKRIGNYLFEEIVKGWQGDKWGPAAGIQLTNKPGKNEYIFFGWASE